MNLVHIFRQTPTATESEILATHRRGHDVTEIRLYEDPDYDAIVESIEKSDRVYSW